MRKHKAANVIEIVMKKKTPTGKADHNKNTITVEINDLKKRPEVKNHPFFHAVPIFRPKAKSEERKRGVLIQHEFEDGRKLELRVFEELDINDQDLLLTILSLQYQKFEGKKINANAEEVMKALEIKRYEGFFRETKAQAAKRIANRKKQDPENTKHLDPKKAIPSQEISNVADTFAINFKISRHQLLKLLGKADNPNNYKWLAGSLKRLSSITMWYEGDTWEADIGRMFIGGLDNKTGLVDVYINPISAAAMFVEGFQYITIDLKHRGLLKMDVAKALHYYLCGVVWEGQKQPIYIDTLVEKIYPLLLRNEERTNECLRDQRRKIKQGLKELAEKLEGWQVEIAGTGKEAIAMITRVKKMKEKDSPPLFK